MGVGEEKQQNLEAQALGENVYLMFPWGKCVLTGGYCGPKKKKKTPKNAAYCFSKGFSKDCCSHKVINYWSSHPDLAP